jgi:4-hydroxy-tetrahydrodipicolinate reductase
VLLKLAADAARLLGVGFDAEISELHHRMKVDAPSGTALALARAVGQASGRDVERAQVSERRGMIGKRRDEEIGVMALRGGDVVGDHTVYYLGHGERLELTHRAQSRDCLARGAVRAGLWLARQTKPGLYSMADVLGI